MDYYAILGVPKTASKAQIKEAYMKLARENHPDRFQDPEKRTQAAGTIQRINESYNHLRDERLRREYDQEIARESLPPKEQAERYYRNGVMREELKDYNEAEVLLRSQPSGTGKRTLYWRGGASYGHRSFQGASGRGTLQQGHPTGS